MTGIIEGSLFAFGIFLSGMPLVPWLKKGFSSVGLFDDDDDKSA